MKKLLPILIVLFSSPFIVKAERLPYCGYDATYKHNCTKFFEFTNGESYDGAWKNDKPHGFGVAKGIVDGLVFQMRGEFKNGLPNGLISVTVE